MQRTHSLVGLLSALGLTPFLPSIARAQVVVWNGGSAGDNNWSTDANWVAAHKPANNGAVTVQFAGSTRPNPNIDNSWSFAGLAFNSGASAFTLGGSEVTIGSGGITNDSTNPQALNISNICLGADPTWSASAGDLTVGDNSVYNQGFTLTLTAASEKPLTIPSIIYDDG